MLEWYTGCLSQNGFHQSGLAVFSVDEFACDQVRFVAVLIQESSPNSDITDVTRGPETFQRIASDSFDVHPVTLSIFVSLVKRQLQGI